MCRRSCPPHLPSDFVRPVPPRNGLGMASFLTSLSGFLCGVTFPLGLLMGLVALRRGPRTAAWAGTLLGGAGTLVMLGLGLLIAAVSEAESEASHRRVDPGVARTAAIVMELEERIIDIEVERGEPLPFDQLAAWVESTRDGWNRPLKLEVAPGPRRLLLSAGPDGRFATPDDRERALGAPCRDS